MSDYPLSPFLAPKYWLQWMGVGLLWGLSKFPIAWHPRIGKIIGVILYRASSSRRKVVNTNLKLCFPDLHDTGRTALRKKHYDHLGLMVLDLGVSWWSSPNRLKQLGKIEGLEHIENALAQGKGVVLLVSHMTSMELGGQILAQKLEALGSPLQVMYKRSRSPLVETLLKHGRTRFTKQIFLHKDMRAMFKGLKANLPSWYAPDQDFGPERSVFAPFFGVQTATLTMTSRIIKTSQAPIIPFFPIRSEDGLTVTLKILPALKGIPSGSDQQDAVILNKSIESIVEQHPAQYFWVHRRFKTRPDGEPSVY